MVRAPSLRLLAAVWSVPPLLVLIQASISPGPAALPGVLLREGVPWVIWIVVTPVVFGWAAQPGPLRRRQIAAHLALALGCAVGFGSLVGVGYRVTRPETYTLSAALRMSVADWLPFQPLIYAGVLAAGLAVDAGRRRRDAELARAQLETQLAVAQLSALRAQLQPHFLFNTLNAAVALARAGDADGAARVLILLGELLRQLLRGDAPQEIPLREELSLLESYLEIQRVRFGARLQVGWQVSDDVREALVPQLVLQPLVENALQHGIAPRSRAGRLDITAARHGDRLRLAVCDDGPGLSPEFSLAAATGVGLRNTRERLRRLYGERSHLALATAGDRTTCTIELPLRTAGNGAAGAIELPLHTTDSSAAGAIELPVRTADSGAAGAMELPLHTAGEAIRG